MPLSSFRRLERLAGTAHPVVYRVDFDCPCGEQHPGLVAHDDLDWAPLGLEAGRFLNLLTARIEEVGLELGDAACRQIEAGEWPWSFFCYPEGRPRPVFPSSFFLLAPGGREERLGLAVRCPACERTSLNLVTHEHVDLPVPQRRRDRRGRARLRRRRGADGRRVPVGALFGRFRRPAAAALKTASTGYAGTHDRNRPWRLHGRGSRYRRAADLDLDADRRGDDRRLLGRLRARSRAPA